jgi:hypothetical protein
MVLSAKAEEKRMAKTMRYRSALAIAIDITLPTPTRNPRQLRMDIMNTS